MPFSEKTKLEIKNKAAFRCCRCQNIGIDAHHIIPENEGGSDDIDNGAPLCQNCHDQFGDNPKKRKEIRQMRDRWYKQCEEIYSSSKNWVTQNWEVLNNMNTKLEKIQRGQEDITELKAMLKSISDQLIKDITPQTASMTASAIVNSTNAVKLGPKTYSNFYCSNCNTRIGLLTGLDVCPNCKTKINQY